MEAANILAGVYLVSRRVVESVGTALKENDSCAGPAAKGHPADESRWTEIPADEGPVESFEPAFWQPESARKGDSVGLVPSTPNEGILAITKRSVLFVPPPGVAGVGIPFEAVVKIEGGYVKSQFISVESLCGRSYTFTFLKGPANAVDPRTAEMAASRLKARVAEFQALTQRELGPSQ